MFSKKMFSFLLILSSFSALSAEAVIDPINKPGLFEYLVSDSPVGLNVFVLRQSTRPYQVATVIRSLNKTFKDPRFNSRCEATVKVVDNSYVGHSKANDTRAYGMVTVEVTHTCPSALNMVIQAFDSSPYVEAKVPNKVNFKLAP